MGNMFRLGIGILIILLWLFFPSFFSFAKEVYRWTDEKGDVHFTDDSSKIPAQYQKQFEKREVNEEVSGADKKPGGQASKPSVKPKAKPDRAKEDLKAYEKKIEAKKAIERKISKLEEELRAAEKQVKKIKEIKESKTSGPAVKHHSDGAKHVPVGGAPTKEDKLLLRIRDIKKEIAALEKQLSKIKKGL